MSANHNPKPLPPITYDEHDPVLTGLRIGNAITQIVYGPPLSERDVPDLLRFARRLTSKGTPK